MRRSRRAATLFVLALSLSFVAAAQGLKDAKVAFLSGNWKVLRSTDPMKDTTTCTGIYKDNYSVQLVSDRLFIGLTGGIESVTLRFDDKPAQRLRLAEDVEKKIRSVIIAGMEFTELAESSRLRYQVGTLVSGVKTGELDLTGIRETVENIRSGCPSQPNPEPLQRSFSTGETLCTSALIARMKAQAIKDEQIRDICRP